jgi:uncharacterized protein (UPF0335 family)
MSRVNNQLQQFVSRIEKLEDEKDDIKLSIADLYTEVKAAGYDTKILRKIVAMRRRTPEQQMEETALLVTYMDALGMDSLPLWQAAGGKDGKSDD